jgi:hypothetical protein
VTELFPLLHFGALHAYEKLLVVFIALAPFIAMLVVVTVLRLRDSDEDTDSGTETAEETPGRPVTRGGL